MVMFSILATVCAGLFAGAAGYISLVEHWARIQSGPAVALAQFRPGFPRAKAGQATLAVVGAICAVLAWLIEGGERWILVTLLLLGVVAFTLSKIAPVYNQLLDSGLTAESPEVPDLLVRWGRLHSARSLLGLLAFLVAISIL